MADITQKEIVYSALERYFYEYINTNGVKKVYETLEDIEKTEDIDYLKLLFLRDIMILEDSYFVEYGYCTTYKYYIKKITIRDFDNKIKFICVRFSDIIIDNLINDYENNYKDEEKLSFKDYVFQEIEIVEKIEVTKTEWRAL